MSQTMTARHAVHHTAHAGDHHHPLHAARTPAWTSRATNFGVFAVLALGAVYAITALVTDLSSMPPTTTILPFILLGVALLIALGFEFVNGFHDTANAVATVIYTHSMPAQVAVVWSGIWNLIGVLSSTGLVAFTIVSLLPVELIMRAYMTGVTSTSFWLALNASVRRLTSRPSAAVIACHQTILVFAELVVAGWARTGRINGVATTAAEAASRVRRRIMTEPLLVPWLSMERTQQARSSGLCFGQRRLRRLATKQSSL